MKLARPQNKDISIVMPCLNEIKTVGECVDVAYKYIKDHNLNGEVIVVDNGSTDSSATPSLRLMAAMLLCRTVLPILSHFVATISTGILFFTSHSNISTSEAIGS